MLYTVKMKKIAIKELKENLSDYAEMAAEGEIIEVSKYNRPYVYISGVAEASLHYGSKVGKLNLTSSFKLASKGAWRESLEEDRQD